MRRKSNASIIVLLLIFILLAAFVVLRTRQVTNFRPASQLTEHPQAPSARLGPPDIYSDPTRTPGATDPDIMQANIQENICNPGWSTRSIRPPAHYTDQLKREQIRDFGYEDTDPRDYEEDHLIPLELGGKPRDPRNLWPEPFNTSIPDGGAHSKDRVEGYLHQEVCSGTITLDESQREIATDWYRVYVNLAAAW